VVPKALDGPGGNGLREFPRRRRIPPRHFRHGGGPPAAPRDGGQSRLRLPPPARITTQLSATRMGSRHVSRKALRPLTRPAPTNPSLSGKPESVREGRPTRPDGRPAGLGEPSALETGCPFHCFAAPPEHRRELLLHLKRFGRDISSRQSASSADTISIST